MRYAVFLDKLTQRGDIIPRTYGVGRICSYPSYGTEPTELYCRSVFPNQVFLQPGTYTVDMTVEEGAEKNVRVYTYVDGMAAGQYPAANEDPAEMPYTFTIDSARAVIFTFGVGDWTEDFEWSNFRVHEVNGSAVNVYETRAILPDEIVSGSISEALCAKKAVVIGISPISEAFGFAERTTTFVRVIDMDLPENRTVFRGRVSAISDVMDTSGQIRQELTCVSALDFLEDTGLVSSEGGTYLQTWLTNTLSMHNTWVEPFRRVNLAYAGTGNERLLDISNIINNSKYSIISKILTDGSYLRRVSGSSAAFTMEFKEHYTDDMSYIDVAKEYNTPKDTAFVIGENLQSIRVERNTDGGVYTAVCAVSGVNSDGSRETYTAYNTEMAARYPEIYNLLIKNDEIRCTAPMYEDVTVGGITRREPTEACTAMRAALKAYAEQEAANLSVPPIKITLTAADLAAMGFSGYERFEIGNAHPLVFPKFGYFGQRVRVISLRRRLTDGKIEQITIEQGKVAGKQSSNTLSALIAQLNELNNRADDNLVEQLEIMDAKIEKQTDGVKIKLSHPQGYGAVQHLNLVTDEDGRTDLYADDYLIGGSGGYLIKGMTKAQYDALTTHSNTTIYIVDNSGTTEMYIGDQRITSQGGGGATIETAAVLSSEQMQTWAPSHVLVPVEFRGSAMVYYAQAPSRLVLQGQLALFGVGATSVTANDIMSEVVFDYPDGTRQKIKTYVVGMTTSSVSVAAAYFDVSGAAEVKIGNTPTYNMIFYTSWQSLRVGIAVNVQSYYLNEDEELAATAAAVLYVFVDGGRLGCQSIGIKYDSGQVYSTGIEFGSDAERGFASGISRRTEPSYPNGGDSE